MVSPFTMVFEKVGLAFAASVMNAIILTAVLSAGNSSLYVTSRMLYSMAKEGLAPRIFGKLNKRGVPIWGLVVTSLVGMLAFFASIFGDGVIYIWLMNAVGVTGFIFWLGIAASHYRFRKAYIAQGIHWTIFPINQSGFLSDRYFPLLFVFSFYWRKTIKPLLAMTLTGQVCSLPILASHSFW